MTPFIRFAWLTASVSVFGVASAPELWQRLALGAILAVALLLLRPILVCDIFAWLHQRGKRLKAEAQAG